MLPPKKTLRRIDLEGTGRFLTFSCYRRHRLFGNERIKDRFVDHLTRATVARSVHVIAWVVMPEHVHLVVLPADGTVSNFLRSLKSPFATEVIARWRDLRAAILPKLRDRKGNVHFWQRGGGYDRNVMGGELHEKIDYCHRNPVARGLCASPEDWRWSSARAYAKIADAIGPPIAEDLLPRRR